MQNSPFAQLRGHWASIRSSFLNAWVFRKAGDSAVVVPAFLNLKFQFFGHDMVVSHSRDIRKAQGPLSILQNAQVRPDFLALNGTA